MQRDALGREVLTTVGVNLEKPRVTRRVFDGIGRLLYEVDPLGTERHITYAGGGRVEKERWVDANGLTVRKLIFAYDSRGFVTKRIDGRGSEHFMHYDPAGRLVGESDPDPDRSGERIRQTYVLDRVGRITSNANGEGFRTLTTYSPRGEILRVEDPNHYSATFQYDGNGNTIQQTDQLGLVTEYVYNARNQLVETIDPAGGAKKRYYDIVGNHIGSESATGRKQEKQVDGLDRAVKELDEVLNETTIEYIDDVVTHTTQKITTDRRGHQTTQIFNGFGDLVQVNAPEGLVVGYKHDSLGNVTEIHSENDAGPTVVKYFYDALGRRDIVEDQDGSRRVTTFDPEGNIAQEVLRDGQIIEYQYDSLHRLRKVFVAKGPDEPKTLEQEFEYDRRSLLTRALDYNGGRAVHEYVVEYDAAGRAIVETQDGVSIRRILDGRGETTWVEQPALSYRVFRDPITRSAEYRYTQMTSRPIIKHPPVYHFELGGVGGITRVLDADGRLASYESKSSFVPPEVIFSRVVEYGDRGEVLLQEYRYFGEPLFQDSVVDVDEELNVRGRVQYFAKDLALNPSWETEEDRFTYDGQNRIKTAGLGKQQLDSVWSYDAVGNWIAETHNDVSTTRAVNGDNEYTSVGNFAPQHDARGKYCQCFWEP